MTEEKVYWLGAAERDVRYTKTTWYRCAKMKEFVEKVEKEHVIVGIIFNGSNIGFILR